MNWRLKIAAKVVLSRLGIPYEGWRKLGLFRLGRMDRPDYALKIFDLHILRAIPDGRLDGKTVLEIGPGDSLASAVTARAHGAAEALLVDAGAYASRDVDLYRAMAAALEARGLPPPDLSDAATLEDVLAHCSARYLTTGVDAFADMPDASVDLIWSHSVLEHIPLKQLPHLFGEMRRVLKPEGLISHNIDFQDHLAHGLNSLRFSEAAWESPTMANAGFYTNRVRAGAMHAMVREAGFEILQEDFGRWPAPPIARRDLDPAFRDLSDDELRIATSHLLARPA
ncbi:methyltransferase domain-containing protein [Brevundimonas sp.]|uniref:methyltransferase domain-containing protein n=1 Tax=Brevundimonas sp. TaxID=1871086 RepID=UPI00286AF90D|nr:methyltransferase domain-containing protein [Brevundimonas sp.]